MLKRTKFHTAKVCVIAAVVGLSGCMQEKKEASKAEALSSLPLWIAAPETQVAQGAFAATECVVASDDFGMDKAEAVANARAALAKQVDIRVQTLDKTYKERIKTTNKTVSGSNFSTVSKQVANQSLKGSRVQKLDYVTVNNKRQLCAMVELNPKAALDLFKNAIAGVEQQGVKIPARDEEVLYQEFKQKMAMDELEASLQN